MKHLPQRSRNFLRAGREWAPAWLQWTAAACASLAVVTLLSLALFAALTRWEPGILVAQAPSLAVDRATRPAGMPHPPDETRVIAR